LLAAAAQHPEERAARSVSGSGGLTFALGKAAQWVPWGDRPASGVGCGPDEHRRVGLPSQPAAKHLVNGHITGIIRW